MSALLFNVDQRVRQIGGLGQQVFPADVVEGQFAVLVEREMKYVSFK